MYEELSAAAQRVLNRESDGLDSTFMADILKAVSTNNDAGFYEVSATRRIWNGGDYNGHYGSCIERWRFPTLPAATDFIEKFDWSSYESKPFVRLEPWSKLP